MKKFRVTFQRVFEVDIEADTLDIAQGLARKIVAQFPADTCKLMSVIAEDAVEKPEGSPPAKPPFGRPLGGGSPGTPVVRVPELVDQIAKAA